MGKWRHRRQAHRPRWGCGESDLRLASRRGEGEGGGAASARPGDRASGGSWARGGLAARDRPLRNRKRPLMMKVAVYPGTFDPITLGHLDIIRRSAHLVDRL